MSTTCDKKEASGLGALRGWIVLAATLRLVLMPLTLHGDLLFVQYFPSYLSYQGVWDVYGHLGDTFLRRGYTAYQPAVLYGTALFQYLLKPVNPGFDLFIQKMQLLMMGGMDYQAFLKSMPGTEIMRMIFFMKLPYLVWEAGCCLFLWRCLEGAALKKRALLLWLYNPVVIFSCYVFGQYRALTVFGIWAVLLALKRNRISWACLFFGALFLTETFPIFLVIPALLIFAQDLRSRLRCLFFMAIIPAAVLVPLALDSRGYVFGSYGSATLIKMASQSIFVHYPEIVAAVSKALLASAEFGMIVFLIKRCRGELAAEERFWLFTGSSFVILTCLYATTTTLAHYFMWVMPFFVLIHVPRPPWPRALSWLAILLLFVFNLDHRSTNAQLLMPMNVDYFFSLPSLHEIMERFVPWGKVIAASRLTFSGLCLFFAWRVFTKRLVAPGKSYGK